MREEFLRHESTDVPDDKVVFLRIEDDCSQYESRPRQRKGNQRGVVKIVGMLFAALVLAALIFWVSHSYAEEGRSQTMLGGTICDTLDQLVEPGLETNREVAGCDFLREPAAVRVFSLPKLETKRGIFRLVRFHFLDGRVQYGIEGVEEPPDVGI